MWHKEVYINDRLSALITQTIKSFKTFSEIVHYEVVNDLLLHF